MSRFRLDGRAAFVTGGGRGIGRAIALALAEAGADVLLTYRAQRADAEETVSLISAQGRCAMAVPVDVTDRASVREAAAIASGFGRISVLVNNAGSNRPADFDEIADADWDAVLAPNLKGPFVVTQEFLPVLEAAGGGSIVHIGSVSGQIGGPRSAHFAAAKAGLIGLSQAVARYGAARNIRSNVVAPGRIHSDPAEPAPGAPLTNGILLGRLGTPAEVADAVVFFASDAARYVTGQTLGVNGGLHF